ncbi:MAG: YlxR family protein [Clostridiales bacterium]|nr:YlxR family protein [Clostridiales bacterium]
MRQKKIPLRMCIACREGKPKQEMLRIVKNAEGEIRLDFSGKLAGRGAYICNSAECIRKLKKYRLLNKAFSADVSMEIYDAIEEEFLAKR